MNTMQTQFSTQVGIVDSKDNVFLSPTETRTSMTLSYPISFPSFAYQHSMTQTSTPNPIPPCSFMAPSSTFNQSFQFPHPLTSFNPPQSPTLLQSPIYSLSHSYHSTLQQPQSVTYFPSHAIVSPQISPTIVPQPLSYPLLSAQQLTYTSGLSSVYNPSQININQFNQHVPQSTPSCSSIVIDNALHAEEAEKSIVQTEDDILNEVIENAVSENDVSAETHTLSQSSLSVSESNDQEVVTQKTKFEETLSTINDEQLRMYLNTNLIRPDSVQRKMKWTGKMYETFCERVGIKMFPLSGRIVGAFLHMLAYDCKYTITSLSNVIYPSLLHLQEDAGFDVDETERTLIKAKLKSLQLDPHVKKEGRGKEPLCWFDVLELIDRIPDNFGSKDMEASLFLFALQTGSRACTCGGVTWGDISNYEFDTETGASRIIILQRVTKGNQNWNHKVKLEGFIGTPNNGDFLYFLERHAQKTLKMSIQQVALGQTPPSMKSVKVWNLSLEAMRERLKMRLSQAGFPANVFSFHSFRSGFICSSLLLAGRDPAQQGSVLDHTAFVAGWVPYGRAQKRYIKSVAEVMIVASRLVGAGIGLKRSEVQQKNQNPKEVHVIQTERKRKTSQYQNQNNSSIIVVEKCESAAANTEHPITISSSNIQAASVGFIQTPKTIEEFHNFLLKEPDFGIRGLIMTVKSLFDSKMGLKPESTEDQQRLCRNAWVKALTLVGKSKMDEDEKARATWAQQRLAGHQSLVQRLLDRCDNPETIATDLYNLVKHRYHIETAPPKIFYNVHTLHPTPKQRLMLVKDHGKQVRSRLRWTPEENQILADYYSEHKTFSNITEKLPNRTSADACAHYRHLKKKEIQDKNSKLSDVEKTQNSLDPEA